MTSTQDAASDRVRVRRQPERGHYGRSDIDAVLDAAMVAHVAFVDGDQPVCIPFLYARIGDRIYIHGSTGSRAVRLLSDGAPACLTATVLDGLVLATSAFDHSANYRCVTVLGRFAVVPDSERSSALRAFTERLIPGRWEEVRLPSRKELAQTRVLAMSIDEAAVKVRCGPPSDEAADSTGIWSGVIPITTGFGPPEPAPNLPADLSLPPSVRSLHVRTEHAVLPAAREPDSHDSHSMTGATR